MRALTQILRKLKTLKAALLSGLAALVLATCTASVSGVPGSSAGPGLEDINSSEQPPADVAADPFGQPVAGAGPAPADQLSAPVEPAGDPSEQPGALPDTPKVKFGKVTVHQPKLRVTGVPDSGVIEKIRRVDGVRFATAFDVGQVEIGPADKAVTVAAVEAKEFRLLTPQVTADAVAVWERIVEGDAAFTHDVGYQLQTELQADLGSFVPAGTQGHMLRIGAYASNGIPPVADALVSPQTAAALGVKTRRDVLVSLDEDSDPSAVARRVQRVSGARASVIEPPQSRRAFLTGVDARNQFEPFNYVDMGDGMIQIDPAWVRRNIVRRPMPLLNGEVVCHRMFVDQLYGALKEIEDRGLGHLIDPSQYGGCWVPRHIDFNPARPLSMHAWGLAADFNVSTNGLGMKPQMDRRVVAVFDRWGFVWGGRWSRPDGMHFELGALVQNSPQG